MDAVLQKTGICASASVGSNLFLVKVALDITAKHAPDHIGILDVTEFKRTSWRHRPITDIWNIGNAHSVEPCAIKEIHEYKSKSNSL